MMPMQRLRIAAAAALAALATSAAADETAVRATLERTFPQSPVQGNAETPIARLCEAAVAVPRAELEKQLLRAAKPN